MGSHDFRGKIAVVTGGSRGIGRATALELAGCGADVAFTFFRKYSAAREVARGIEAMGCRALAVKADVGEEADIRNIFKAVRDEWGHLDFYISNAASGFFKPLTKLQPVHWEYILSTNLTATILGCRLAYEAMPGGRGAIVLMSSLGSHRHMDKYGAMGACKAAIESLGRSLAVELAPGVNVNAICGGIIATDSLKTVSAGNEDVLKRLIDRSPMGRIGEPEHVAKVAAFLCSEDAEWIRGQTIVVDGGLTLLL